MNYNREISNNKAGISATWNNGEDIRTELRCYKTATTINKNRNNMNKQLIRNLCH